MPPTSLFASSRERKLWAWTAALVLTLYATLGLAPRLASALPAEFRDSVWVTLTFLSGMLLVGLTSLVHGLRARPRGLEIVVALAVATLYIMLLVRIAVPEERTHLIEYGVIAILIHAALLERRSHGRTVPRPALLAIVATALTGALDEGIQYLLPNRVFDPVDMLFNTLAAVMAVGSSGALAWARRRSRRASGPSRQA